MAAAAKSYRNAPRSRGKKHKGRTRPLRKSQANLKLVKGKGIHLDIKWNPTCLKDLQRKCYYLRRMHNMTQKQLADKVGMNPSTIIRYEDESLPMIAPRLRTFVKIFKEGFGASIAVEVAE